MEFDKAKQALTEADNQFELEDQLRELDNPETPTDTREVTTGELATAQAAEFQPRDVVDIELTALRERGKFRPHFFPPTNQ